MKLTLFVLSLCLLPLPALGGVYKWVDSEGRVHFGDRPPEQASAEPVAIEPPPVSDDAIEESRQQRMIDFVEQSQQERAQRRAAAAKAEQAAQKRAEACRRMKARVTFNESISSFYRVNDQGEREFYSDAQGQKIRAHYGAKAAEACGD